MIRAHQLRALAVRAQCDPRTAARFVAGITVLPMLQTRLTAAALELGITIPTAPSQLALTSAAPLVAAAATGKAVA